MNEPRAQATGLQPAAPSAPGVSRRDWLIRASATAASIGALGALGCAACSKPESQAASAAPPAPAAKPPLFRISLAEWSVHRAVQSGSMDHLDFPKTAKHDYDIDAVEYVSTLFKKGAAADYIADLRKRCDDLGATSVLIMCDGEGALGDPDDAKRTQAVENHRKWLDAAKALGCHSIRVNAESTGGWEEQQRLCADGLHRLCEFADPLDLNVIVENHGGGVACNGAWLAGLMRRTCHLRVGTLPDFGNFDPRQYDRYEGVRDMMPWARGVSAKSHDFDAAGEETGIDYRRMMGIVLAAGYHGRLGIEYEGDRMSEPDGIRATKRLLETILAERTESHA